MWLSTHYFSGFLQDWFNVFLYEIKKNSVWYNFYHGTSVSITFYIFEHYQLRLMDSKGQRVFFPKTPQLCVWHTEVRRCYHFKLVSHFQLWFPIWGVLVNRLNSVHAEELRDLGLLRRPTPSLTPTTASRPQRRRYKRCERKQKRGKRGGIRARLAANPHKPAIPSIVLANVRSLDNKLDHIRLLRSTQRTVRDCCVLCLRKHGLTTAFRTAPFSSSS